jgi:hypothetical protein
MPLVDETELGADVLATFATRRGTATASRPDRDGRPLPRPLDAILAERRSVRNFGDDAVDGPTLTAVLRDAGRSATGHVGAAAPGLAMTVAAYDVEGLSAGAYAVDPGGALSAVAGPSDVAPFPARYADAPALIAVCGDIGWACAAGPGYAGLLVGAGALGYAVWLAALTHGLVASAYGAPSEELTRIAQRADPNLRHLFTVAVGRLP